MTDFNLQELGLAFWEACSFTPGRTLLNGVDFETDAHYGSLTVEGPLYRLLLQASEGWFTGFQTIGEQDRGPRR